MKWPCLRPATATAAWVSVLGCLLWESLLLGRRTGVLGQTDEEVVAPQTFCNGRGLINSNLTCSCLSGFRGPDCSLRMCPVGRAWVDFPSAANTAHADGVECSNMGICNRESGLCQCRTGFVGQACDRLGCPSDCSGHGRCLSMAEAAEGWDGRILVRPRVEYVSVWDADILYGCVCDPGWIGHDCSQLECPKGDDPLTSDQQNEVMRIVCQADSGSFTLSFRGVTSADISFNASYGYVKELLESMDTITEVDVSMSTDGAVCGQDFEVVTRVEFVQDFGSLPAAFVSYDDLELAGGDPILNLETLTQIVCPACPSCSGGIYLIYDDETTSSIPVSANASEVQAVLSSLDTLGPASVYDDLASLNVTMDGGGTLCASADTVTTLISIRSPYGNLPSFTFLGSVRNAIGAAVELTFSDGKGTKENIYCANHGVCDFDTGTCVCDRNTTAFPDEWYWWESSDGYGGPGGRPDCGYQRVESSTNTSQGCPVGIVFADANSPTFENMDKIPCSGKGTCDESTGSCTCSPGFYGGDCSQRQCPTGKAWFDEARANDSAHSYGAECGAMGNCDHASGECICRDGWTGAACERLACAENCSENGACLPMYRLAQLRENNGEQDPVVYGVSDLVRPWGSSVYASPSTWDFDMMYGCFCDSGERGGGDSDGFYGGIYRPRVGTRGYISGVFTDNSKLAGWGGYMCSERLCPSGDNVRSSSGEFEVQTVACTLRSGAFTISFRGATTEAISPNATTSEVATAIELLSTIGSVSVAFTSGDAACNSTWGFGEGIQVTFLTELGDLPTLRTSPLFSVNSTKDGSKGNAECAGNGICDFGAGECTCLDGWGSSDGDGGTGDRGDCGFRNEFCTDQTHNAQTREETYELLLAVEL